MQIARPQPLASIIITCYNYADFVGECIESALSQTYPRTEVIVVDDGSTDASRSVISRYGNQVSPVFKENGGMGSAFNAGFAASRGGIVLFLDADDSLYPDAAQAAVDQFAGRDVSKVHWPLTTLDDHGRPTGIHPSQPLSEGALLDRVVAGGPEGYVWPVTSGNAWNRAFLENVLPIPEEAYSYAAESYLAALAPAFGPIARLSQPMGTYRMHGRSLSFSRTVSDRLGKQTQQFRALGDKLRQLGIAGDVDSWHPPRAYRDRAQSVCRKLEAAIAPGSRFAFVQWGQWGPGKIVSHGEALPFLERDGQYIGTPEDDDTAIREIERMRGEGVDHIAFAWPALWWLEYYTGFAAYLKASYRCIASCDDMVIFDLSSLRAGGGATR